MEAVIQAINKKAAGSSISSKLRRSGGLGEDSQVELEFFSFTKADETMLQHMANEASVCLRNANMLDSQKKSAQKSNLMIKLLTTFTADLDTQKAIENICGECILRSNPLEQVLYQHLFSNTIFFTYPTLHRVRSRTSECRPSVPFPLGRAVQRAGLQRV